MDKLRNASLCLLALSLFVMLFHWLVAPLGDWAVRIAGIGMLIGIPALVFSLVRGKKQR